MTEIRRAKIAMKCLAPVLLLLGTVATPAVAADWREKQEIWWNNPTLVHNAIADFLALRDDQGKWPPSGNLYQSMMELLLVLDKDKSEKAREALADLSAYDLGAAGSEIYTCLVVRKGGAMIPLLQKQDAIGEADDCRTRLGTKHPSCRAARQPSSRHEWITSLIANVKANELCGIEQ